VKRSKVNLQGAGTYCGGLPHSLFHYTFRPTSDSGGERILKIGQQRAKLWTKVGCLVFVTHGVQMVDKCGGYRREYINTAAAAAAAAASTTFDFCLTGAYPEITSG